MSCSTCDKAKPILRCTSVLTVGTIAAYPSTAIEIYIKNNTTGRVLRHAATTSGAGLITHNISVNQYMEGHDYEVWVTLASATNPEARIPFVVGSETVDCVSVRFLPVYDGTTEALESGNQTISLES